MICVFVAAMAILVGVCGMARKHDYANYLAEFNAQVPVSVQQTSWDNVKKIAHGSFLPMSDYVYLWMFADKYRIEEYPEPTRTVGTSHIPDWQGLIRSLKDAEEKAKAQGVSQEDFSEAVRKMFSYQDGDPIAFLD